MLFAESMSQLWLTYYGISILVLGAVYLAFAFLPRPVRLPLTWAIGGAMWMPASFTLPLEAYAGWAPSAMVAAVGFLEQDSAAFGAGLAWLLSGVVLGAFVGIALWWRRRPEGGREDRRTPPDAGRPAATPKAAESDTRRREPVIG